MKQITLKDFEIVVDDFTKKTIHIDRDQLCQCLMDTYMDELGADVRIEKKKIGIEERKTARECIEVPRYSCYIVWYKHPFDESQTGFKVNFIPKKEHETSFTKSLAEFLHFYDNPNGLFRLESLSFLFQ